jgi:hypothetical protein
MRSIEREFWWLLSKSPRCPYKKRIKRPPVLPLQSKHESSTISPVDESFLYIAPLRRLLTVGSESTLKRSSILHDGILCNIQHRLIRRHYCTRNVCFPCEHPRSCSRSRRRAPPNRRLLSRSKPSRIRRFSVVISGAREFYDISTKRRRDCSELDCIKYNYNCHFVSFTLPNASSLNQKK